MSDTPGDARQTNGAGAAPAEDGASAAPGALPLFYRTPEPLRADTHGALKVDLTPHYGFARNAHAVPLNAIEFAAAARHYPIVFAAGSTPPAAVAVLGLRRDANLFVNAAGGWVEDLYVPSYLRRYPFILARDAQGKDFALCVDVASDKVGEAAGHALFAEGAASEATRKALEFCSAFHREAQASAAALEKLAEHDLLIPNEGRFTLSSGEVLTVNDFLVVSEERFAALSDAAFLDLRKAGTLPAIYCHLLSMRCWSDLVRRLEAQA
ncbi:SapC family protein [Stappia sp.]|uniref:SapC family protein n=1 Tax=Stappia sp. TaxID=1870903 RepID=UPI0032D8FB68